MLVEGLLLRWQGRECMLLANLSAETQRVRVELSAAQVQARALDQTTVASALADPQSFLAETGHTLTTDQGWLTLELLPYATVRIDS